MTKKIKNLDSNDFHVAQLIAEGRPEAEILCVYQKSRSSLQRLKARSDFQVLVEEARRGLKTAIAEVSYTSSKERHLQKLEQYRENREKLGMELVRSGLKLLKLINQRLENAEANDLSPNQIPSHLRGVCMALESGFDMTAQALGVEKMLEIFHSIE